MTIFVTIQKMSDKSFESNFGNDIMNDIKKEIQLHERGKKQRVRVIEDKQNKTYRNAEQAYWAFVQKYYQGKRFKDAFGVEKKFKKLIKLDDFSQNTRRTLLLTKLGLMAGKSVSEICDDLDIKNRALVLKVLKASIQVISEDINMMSPNDLFSQYALQKKDLIDRLKGQLDRIESFWDVHDGNMMYHREYAGIVKIISDIQDTIMKTGTDLQIYKKEGEDRVINFNFGDNLLPDVPQLEAPKEEVKPNVPTGPAKDHVEGNVVVCENGELNRKAEAEMHYTKVEQSQKEAIIYEHKFKNMACSHITEAQNEANLDISDCEPEEPIWEDPE